MSVLLNISLAEINKIELLQCLLSRLEDDLRAVTAAQKAAQEGATHEENRAESDKDMRATEVAYLARGQAERVVSLREELDLLRALRLQSFTEKSPISATALLLLECEERQTVYFLVPAGGGLRLPYEGPAGKCEIQILTPRSPLGQLLLGMHQGDVVDLESAEGTREYEIVALA